VNGAIHIGQRFDRRLDARDHLAIENYLIPHEPVECAGDGALYALDGVVHQAARARIHCTNGRHLARRGIAGARQRRQVRESDTDRPGRPVTGGFRILGPHALLYCVD
jgi:hypothetical protein